MNTAETARKALEILDRDGWCKGTLSWRRPYRPSSHCLAGTWNMALYGDWAFPLEMADHGAEYEPLLAAIREQYPDMEEEAKEDWHSLGLITWFNDRGRTAEADVRAVLEKLAAEDTWT